MIFLNKFKLGKEKENFETIRINIQNGIEFKGTNLWILIFAILIASLGLNVNSTAVIIGAMLISPIMGPIIGVGFGMAINDLALLQKSFASYIFAAIVGLATSTVFFIISPIDEAHSEILSRTAPTIYDVLIALFGGFAGILAISSKVKGNVIPGAAISTALMPPLCTAGYGLATLQFQFFFGAFYLFIINTVFISLAALITSLFLKFPFTQLPEKKDELKAKKIVFVIVIITLLPSIYLSYDMIQQRKFKQNANHFIEIEAIFPQDFLLKKSIDTNKKIITLTYGGNTIDTTEIIKLRNKLPHYYLDNTTLVIKQGFTNIKESNEHTVQLSLEFLKKENQIKILQKKTDSLKEQNLLGKQVFNELKIHYPSIVSYALQPTTYHHTNSIEHPLWIAILNSKKKWQEKDKEKITHWLKVRLNIKQIKIYFEN